MKNRIFALLALVVVGCAHPGVTQVPPSPPPTVTLTWTAPSGCSSCTYVISRTTAATTCPQSGYTPLNQSSPASGTTYTDSAPPTGVSVCYLAQAVLAGLTGQPSTPSNGGTPLVVPVYPGTPGSPNASAVASLAPPLKPGAQSDPQMAVCGFNNPFCNPLTASPITLTASLVKK